MPAFYRIGIMCRICDGKIH